MTDIVIQGIGGRMGHVLCDMIAQREDCRVIAGIDLKDGDQNGIPVYDSLEKLNGKGDVIIDFSSPAAVEKALPYCNIVCLTGADLLEALPGYLEVLYNASPAAVGGEMPDNSFYFA